MRIRLAMVTGVSVLVAALAVAMGATTAAAGAAGSTTATPSWGTVPYSSLTVSSGGPSSGSVTELTGVTCTGYGNCVASGVQEVLGVAGNAVVAVENGPGQWSQPVTAPLPTNAKNGGTAVLLSVACASATSCVAVGNYTTTSNGDQPLAVPFTVAGSSVTFGTPQQVALPGNALTTSSQGSFLSSVSCGASGCAAAGTYETNAGTPIWTAITATPGAGGAWSATAVTPTSGAVNDNVLNAISCPSSGACEAVGSSANGANDMQLWAVQVAGGVAGTAQPVTIPGANTQTDSAPQAGSFLDLRGGLSAVSCPSTGVCVAAGTFEGAVSEPTAVLVPINNGNPAQGVPLTVNGSDVFAELNGISCVDAIDCTTTGFALATGESGAVFVASEIAGTWSPVVLPDVSPGAAGFTTAVGTGVACTSPTVCVGTGLTIGESASATTTSETVSSFFAYSAITPSVTTTSLPAANVGVPYSATLQSTGGLGTGSWAVALGSLPAGLTLNASTGVISGTPTAVGQSGFAVTETNAGPPSLVSASTSLSISVGPVASVAIGYSKVSGNTAVVVLTCAGAPCTGSYELTGIEHMRKGKPTAVDAKAKKKPTTRTIVLASGHYSLTAGGTRALVIKLNATGAKLLRKLHRISGQLTVTPTGATKPALVEKLTFRSKKR